MPALSAPLQERSGRCCRPFASPANPVDITPVWSRFAELYPALIDLLARSGEVDAVVPVLLQRAALDEATAEGLRDVVAGLRADDVACRCTCAGWRPVTRGPTPTSLQDAGVPCFDWPARTARAIGHARRYAVARRPDDARARAARRRCGRVPTPTDPVRVAELLAELGVDTAPSTALPHRRRGRRRGDRVPRGGEDRRGRAPHRAGRGAAGAADAAAVRGGGGRAAGNRARCWCSASCPGWRSRSAGVRDPVFGPVVMVGLGGIWVEVLADVAFAMAPLHRAEARSLLGVAARAPRCSPAARGGPPSTSTRWPTSSSPPGPAAGLPGRRRARPQPRPRHRRFAVAVDWKIGVAPDCSPDTAVRSVTGRPGHGVDSDGAAGGELHPGDAHLRVLPRPEPARRAAAAVPARGARRRATSASASPTIPTPSGRGPLSRVGRASSVDAAPAQLQPMDSASTYLSGRVLRDREDDRTSGSSGDRSRRWPSRASASCGPWAR